MLKGINKLLLKFNIIRGKLLVAQKLISFLLFQVPAFLQKAMPRIFYYFIDAMKFGSIGLYLLPKCDWLGTYPTHLCILKSIYTPTC